MEALHKNERHYKEDVNELRSYDDKREFGDLALLHRLVLYRSLHPPDRSTALSIHIH